MSAGAVALGRELTREPTARERERAGAAELAARWRNRTAGEIFPATVGYSPGVGYVSGNSKPSLRARRIGIAPVSGCAQALDRQAAGILVKHRCGGMLRATYVDASGTMVTTIGIAIMPTPAEATKAETDFSSIGGTARYGLLPVRFTGTAADRYGAGQRQDLALVRNNAPYVFFRASGWADGRPTLKEAERDANEFDFARQIAGHLMDGFVAAKDPCETEDVRC